MVDQLKSSQRKPVHFGDDATKTTAETSTGQNIRVVETTVMVTDNEMHTPATENGEKQQKLVCSSPIAGTTSDASTRFSHFSP